VKTASLKAKLQRFKVLGRRCRSCNRTDEDLSFRFSDLCCTCWGRGEHNGYCYCGAAKVRDRSKAVLERTSVCPRGHR